jgi:hypothetical protein
MMMIEMRKDLTPSIVHIKHHLFLLEKVSFIRYVRILFNKLSFLNFVYVDGIKYQFFHCHVYIFISINFSFFPVHALTSDNHENNQKEKKKTIYSSNIF